MSSTPATWRVYVQDWIIAYTTDATGSASYAEAAQVLADRWEGRVAEGDFGIQFAGDPGQRAVRSQVLLRMPVLQGEWKQQDDAEAHAERIRGTERVSPPAGVRLPGLPEIVETGSAEERVLLDYGKKKLRV